MTKKDDRITAQAETSAPKPKQSPGTARAKTKGPDQDGDSRGKGEGGTSERRSKTKTSAHKSNKPGPRNKPKSGGPKSKSKSGGRGKSGKGRGGRKSRPDPTRLVPINENLERFQEHLKADFSEATFIVFDIETTGGNPEKNGITEIFAIKYQGGKILDKFYSMVNPKVSIPPIVRRMTGISNSMVKDAPLIADVMPGFVEFIGNHVLVSHNTIGDMKFIRYFAKQVTGEEVRNFYMCTHLLVEKLVSEAPDKSLKGLAKFFEFEGKEFHRAEADTILTQKLLDELLKRLRAKTITYVEQGIRLQGDLESGMRLGWAIDDTKMDEVPHKPGVFYLFDHERRLLFLSSAISLQRDIKGLKRYHQLPRALLRLVLQAYDIQYESHPSHFSAMLAECQSLSLHQISLVPSNWHQRTLTAFCFNEEPEGIRLCVGTITKGTIAAYGPVRDRKQAQKTLDKIATATSLKAGKRGILMDRGAKLKMVHSLFTGDLPQEKSQTVSDYLKVWSWLSSNFWEQQRERMGLLRQLGDLEKKVRVGNLLELTGLLVTPSKDDNAWLLYEVVDSKPRFIKEVTGQIEEVVKDPDLKREITSKVRLTPNPEPLQSTPLGGDDAPSINAVLWWFHTGLQKRDGRFYELTELPG